MVVFMRIIVVMVILIGLGTGGSVQAKGVPEETDFLKAIHRQLLLRTEKFEITCDKQIAAFYEDAPNDLLKEALAIRDQYTSYDFDFLRYSIAQANVVVRKSLVNHPVFCFEVKYYDNANALQELKGTVKNVLENLRLKSDDPEVKVSKIHDYIVTRSALNGGGGQNGAYDVLVKRSATSRGYALLTYKMLYDTGIPVRIVDGSLDGRPHVWNLVELSGVWYHLDTAADDMHTKSIIPVTYNFFLVGNNTTAKTHELSGFYKTVDFGADLNISMTDYAKRKQLILAAQATQVRKKSGIGIFDESYNYLSNAVLDPFDTLNDKVTNFLLDTLEPIFGI